MVSLARTTVSPWIDSLHGANLYRFSIEDRMRMGRHLNEFFECQRQFIGVRNACMRYPLSIAQFV